jgi:hypothetical protein
MSDKIKPLISYCNLFNKQIRIAPYFLIRQQLVLLEKLDSDVTSAVETVYDLKQALNELLNGVLVKGYTMEEATGDRSFIPLAVLGKFGLTVIDQEDGSVKILYGRMVMNWADSEG